MKNKIRVLLCPSDLAGVGHFRNIWPAQEMERENSDEFLVEICPDYIDDMNYYKNFDIIHFHRQFGSYDDLHKKTEELRKHGVITVMDLDDYWIPPKTHPMYIAAMNDKLPEKIISAFKCSDYVTTTTNIFANHIKKYNTNVFVIPNGIDMSHPMWSEKNTKKTDKLRISVICGSSHLNDLELLADSMNILHNDSSFKDKYQIVMCGYDSRGFMTELGPNGEVISNRKILPHETVWNKFEQILTNNYNKNVVDEDYQKWLLKYKNEEYSKFDVYTSNYVRRWTLPLTRYGEHYNYCDVLLAPLDENIFNEVKSELKIIEAGLTRKTLIATEFGIYKDLIQNGVNGILISKRENVRGWFTAIKKLLNDKEYREMLADNLYNYVINKYTLHAVTKTRVEFYREIIKKRNENQSIIADSSVETTA